MHLLDTTHTAYFFDFRAVLYIFVICLNGVEQSRFWCQADFLSRWISSRWPFSDGRKFCLAWLGLVSLGYSLILWGFYGKNLSKFNRLNPLFQNQNIFVFQSLPNIPVRPNSKSECSSICDDDYLLPTDLEMPKNCNKKIKNLL